jgi:hypothetical protein
MPKITIDDIDYNTEDLTENGKAQLASLQFLEGQMQKIRNEMAVYQTAQRTYIAALKAEIEKSGIQPVAEAAQTDEAVQPDE